MYNNTDPTAGVTSGSTGQEVANSYGLNVRTVYRYTRDMTGPAGGMRSYSAGVRNQRAWILDRLGYSPADIGRVMGVSPSTGWRMVRGDKYGNPSIVVRALEGIKDEGGQVMPKGQCGVLTALDDEGARIEVYNGRTLLVSWAEVLGLLKYVGVA